jgi:hypothetical protein
MFGTGNALYAQIGYLMKKDLLGEGNGTLMPYASIMSADWDRLNDGMQVMDVGVNWFIKGQNSKLSFDYQNRPFYKQNGNELVKEGTRGQVVLQYQLFF